MPIIMPIRDLRNTSEISEIAHKEQEPIFIDKFAGVNRIDQAIYESELEAANGFEPVDAEEVFSELEKKYFG